MNKNVETTIQAAECAQLLLQNLQNLSREGDPILCLLIKSEIHVVQGIKERLESLTVALADGVDYLSCKADDRATELNNLRARLKEDVRTIASIMDSFPLRN